MSLIKKPSPQTYKVPIFLELKALYQEWIKCSQMDKQITNVDLQGDKWRS
jgi:hypothetical protein